MINTTTVSTVCIESDMEASARSCSFAAYSVRINGAGVRKIRHVAQIFNAI